MELDQLIKLFPIKWLHDYVSNTYFPSLKGGITFPFSAEIPVFGTSKTLLVIQMYFLINHLCKIILKENKLFPLVYII